MRTNHISYPTVFQYYYTVLCLGCGLKILETQQASSRAKHTCTGTGRLLCLCCIHCKLEVAATLPWKGEAHSLPQCKAAAASISLLGLTILDLHLWKWPKSKQIRAVMHHSCLPAKESQDPTYILTPCTPPSLQGNCTGLSGLLDCSMSAT